MASSFLTDSECNYKSSNSVIFLLFSPLQSSSELKNNLKTLYAQVVQYNDPSTQPLKLMCDAVNGVPPRKGLLQKIFAGLVAINGNLTCYVNAPPSDTFAQTLLGWSWQVGNMYLSPIYATCIFITLLFIALLEKLIRQLSHRVKPI